MMASFGRRKDDTLHGVLVQAHLVAGNGSSCKREAVAALKFTGSLGLRNMEASKAVKKSGDHRKYECRKTF